MRGQLAGALPVGAVLHLVPDRGGHRRVERRPTVQVRTWDREVVQARGHFNRPPHPDELRVLARWAQAGDLTLSPALVSDPAP